MAELIVHLHENREESFGFDLTPLPEEHPVSMLEDTRFYYKEIHQRAGMKHELPPFVWRSCSNWILNPDNPGRKIRADVKHVALCNEEGQSPHPLRRAQLKRRVWNAKYHFWTLDLNGQRLITKACEGEEPYAFPGDPMYRVWLGFIRQFAVIPVARGLTGIDYLLLESGL